jgi:hypothetical protein
VLARGDLPDLETARAAVAPPQPAAVPTVTVTPPDLAGYDRLVRRHDKLPPCRHEELTPFE